MYYKIFVVFIFILFFIPLSSYSAAVNQEFAGTEGDFYEEDFWRGVQAFHNEQYEEAISSLEVVLAFWIDSPQNHLYLSSAAKLYCLALIKGGHQEVARKACTSFHEKGVLDEEGLYNCGVAALQGGDFQLAYQVLSQAANSLETPSFDFVYVAALSAFNLGKWQDAEVFFKKSLQQKKFPSETLEGEKKSFFQNYYLGLAQFRQGKFQVAYGTLEPLYRQHGWDGVAQELFAAERRRALSIGLHCALQLYSQTAQTSWWNKAYSLAEILVESSEGPRQKQEAVLLSAKIYSDGGKYQQALELLKPYLRGQDLLSLSCGFLGSELLTSLGKLEEASKLYGEIAEICRTAHFPQRQREILELGDRAAYRQGELLYSVGKNQEAAAAFASYRRNYPSGSYRDAALYFNGEALKQTGAIHQAILQHETLLKHHPKSPYVFSSLVGLVDLYKKTGEYERGVVVGEQVVRDFPQQAQEAQIGGKLAELRLLAQGMELTQASLLAEYSEAGKTGTVAGRQLGLELARFYVDSFDSTGEGELLLLQILEQYGAGEEAVAAGAATLLGDLYRGQNKYREAASYFLQAAQFYLATGYLQEEAAAALYRGAESFDVAGMTADSQAVARQLASLFPDSSWTQAAKIFL